VWSLRAIKAPQRLVRSFKGYYINGNKSHESVPL
jgi:hypothetical protein